MNYKLLLCCLLVFLSLNASAQVEKQIDTTINGYKPIISVDRVKLLQNVDMIANMQFGQRNEFVNGSYDRGRFTMNQFRLEIKGKVFDKVYFRFRNRYTSVPQPQSVDNLSRSIDIISIRVDATPKWSFTFGKMCADWGGYEFDLNPIDIYKYNDIVEFADNFLAGVQASWQAMPNHQFTFQLLNSRTKSFQELYDTIPGITEAKFPAALVANWRGNFANGLFQTLWSYSVFQEAKKTNMYYLALGNQLTFKKVQIQYDFKWSNEDLDRTTVVSAIVPNSLIPHAVQNVDYFEHWLRVVWHFQRHWSLAGIGMVSDAYWRSDPYASGSQHLRTHWTYIPSLEFYPYTNLNLKFYLAYIGDVYRYSDHAKTTFGAENGTLGNIMIGFISPLLVL